MPRDYYTVPSLVLIVQAVFLCFPLKRKQTDRQTDRQTNRHVTELPTHAGGYTACVGNNDYVILITITVIIIQHTAHNFTVRHTSDMKITTALIISRTETMTYGLPQSKMTIDIHSYLCCRNDICCSETKVTNLDVIVWWQEDVYWLQVSVNHTLQTAYMHKGCGISDLRLLPYFDTINWVTERISGPQKNLCDLSPKISL